MSHMHSNIYNNFWNLDEDKHNSILHDAFFNLRITMR